MCGPGLELSVIASYIPVLSQGDPFFPCSLRYNRDQKSSMCRDYEDLLRLFIQLQSLMGRRQRSGSFRVK